MADRTTDSKTTVRDSTWTRRYWAVCLWLLVLIALFYWFTVYFG